MVLGRRNLAKERAHILSALSRKMHADHHAYMVRLATHPIGQPFDPKRAWHFNTEEMAAEGRALIARYPTAEDYIRAKIAEELADLPPGDAGPQVVLRWSMSPRAAQAAIREAEHWHVDVYVARIEDSAAP